MIKAIVVDDEWYNIVEIVDLIEKTGFMIVEKQYENPIEALEELDKISPEVAFIDIEMPEIDGITLAEKLLEKNPTMIIVFITAWNQYAVQAFEINALDYIMKPINVERFNKMAERIKNEVALKQKSHSKELKIQSFNKLEVSIDGKKVIWQRTKAEELFAFLLMNNGNYVHKDTILEYLWPEYERSKALPILQTSICKIRNIFSDFKKEVLIDYKGSKYGLFLNAVEYDYAKLERAIANYSVTNIATYENLEKACKSFGNGFLTQQCYVWSMERSEEIRKKLERIMKEILYEYTSNQNFEKQLIVLELLVVLAPHEEEIYYKLLIILEKLGKYTEVVQRIQLIKNNFKQEHEIFLSTRLEEMLSKYN
jgi:two-component system, LytTR family, response regulator